MTVQILYDRGIPVSGEEIKHLNSERIEVVSKPENTSSSYIWLAYVVAIIFWPAGLMAGGIMAFMKITIYNGDQVYAYSEKDRSHGKWILLISLMFFIIWIYRFF